MRLTSFLQSSRHLNVVGLANGHGGRHLGCERAILTLRESLFKNCRVPLKWRAEIEETISGRHADALSGVIANSRNLSSVVQRVLEEEVDRIKADNRHLLVIGGDHSCAIGTWSGVSSAMREFGDVGLIWIDAHMDAHTIETSPTKNLHGTPVAHLLGFGHESLCTIGDAKPKIKPQNLCMLGIRSFEEPEQKLLSRLGVRIIYDSDVERRGISDCMNEAIDYVNRRTVGFGMSIDLDAFRVKDAPAVGTGERGGIVASEFLDYIRENPFEARLLATEVVEFMPHRDDLWRRTERLVCDLVESIYLPKVHEIQREPEVGNRRREVAH